MKFYANFPTIEDILSIDAMESLRQKSLDLRSDPWQNNSGAWYGSKKITVIKWADKLQTTCQTIKYLIIKQSVPDRMDPALVNYTTESLLMGQKKRRM